MTVWFPWKVQEGNRAKLLHPSWRHCGYPPPGGRTTNWSPSIKMNCCGLSPDHPGASEQSVRESVLWSIHLFITKLFFLASEVKVHVGTRPTPHFVLFPLYTHRSEWTATVRDEAGRSIAYILCLIKSV